MTGFPVDDETLDLIELHLLGEYGLSFTRLLDLLSCYDADKSVEDWEVAHYQGGFIYSRDDVILALIAEVRRLRGAHVSD